MAFWATGRWRYLQRNWRTGRTAPWCGLPPPSPCFRNHAAGAFRFPRRKTSSTLPQDATQSGRGAAPSLSSYTALPLSKLLRIRMPGLLKLREHAVHRGQANVERSSSSTRNTSSAVMWRCTPFWKISMNLQARQGGFESRALSSSILVMGGPCLRLRGRARPCEGGCRYNGIDHILALFPMPDQACCSARLGWHSLGQRRSRCPGGMWQLRRCQPSWPTQSLPTRSTSSKATSCRASR